jgi:hypothetical protein
VLFCFEVLGVLFLRARGFPVACRPLWWPIDKCNAIFGKKYVFFNWKILQFFYIRTEINTGTDPQECFFTI